MESDFSKFVRENDIKFIRLSFVDLNGQQKNIAVLADNIDSIINNGLSIIGKPKCKVSEILKIFGAIDNLATCL